MEQQEKTTFGFETAFQYMKEGKEVSRLQFRDTCTVFAQYPKPESKMTKPYIAMKKQASVKSLEDSIMQYDYFPLDLSCESLFANDWYLV